MIPIFYSSKHRKHIPEYEFMGDIFDHHQEIPKRIEIIKLELQQKKEEFIVKKPKNFPDDAILKTHSTRYINFLKNYYRDDELATPYPTVFPIGNFKQFPKHTEGKHGFFFSDLSTPLYQNTYPIARDAANVAISAFEELMKTSLKLSYALTRPPGHHAAMENTGGFCYLNNAAIVANHALLKGYKPIILDIDYHHGNGTQSIFYDKSEVAFVSIHGDPSDNFPYFSGYKNELGKGLGKGFNYNYPLKTFASSKEYFSTLNLALQKMNTLINKNSFNILIISLGFDIFRKDELGSFNLNVGDFKAIGQKIYKEIKLPTVIIQEGGYVVPLLGKMASKFLEGMKI